MDLKHYEFLADLFEYPEQSYFEKVFYVLSFLKKDYSSAAKEVQIFMDHLHPQQLDCVQELYTRCFDVQSITTLDVGYVLFGDDYKRGEILSHLNMEHQKVQNDCKRELADHLPNLLRLISKSEDSELMGDLVHEILAPALRKMIDEFDPQRMTQKNELYKKHYNTLIETPHYNVSAYRHVLKAIFFVISQDFQIQENAKSEYAYNDFLVSLNTEMSVEKIFKE